MDDKYWSKIAYSEHGIDHCHDEAIHKIGAVQSYAMMVVVESNDAICAVSENFCEKVLLKPSDIIGKNLFDISYLDTITKEDLKRADRGRFTKQLSDNRDFISIHKLGQFTFIEIEPNQRQEGGVLSINVTEILNDIGTISDELELLRAATFSIKKISGYDRVLIYRFEPNGDGCVVTESKLDFLEPFLDLRYPASDIPSQARKLFLAGNSRTIQDVDSMPSPLYTRKGIAPGDLDLSKTYFRANSPFHTRYLQNMGVKATMSIPIKVDGALWGLIACHHYSQPKCLSQENRMNCELIGSFLSSKVTSILQERKSVLKNNIFELAQDILDRITEGRDISQSFEKSSVKLLEAVNAQGFMMKMGKDSVSVGDVPNNEVLRNTLAKLRRTKEVNVWSTSKSSDHEIPYHKNSVGILAVPLSLNFDDYLIWFRPAAEQTIKWGGAPKTKVSEKADRLTPRGSFDLWKENITNMSLEWKPEQIDAGQFILYSFVRDIFKKAGDLSKANQKLIDISKSKDEFIGMVSHELRTPLNVLVGWIKILKTTSLDEQGIEAAEILERNTNIQINLIDDLLDVSRIISGKMRMKFQKSIDVVKIIKEVITDTKETAKLRNISIEFNGLSEMYTSGDPSRIKQVIWNLVTNAIKYNNKNGSVVIGLNKLASSVQITISDTGIGISKDKLETVFERFVQTNDDSKRSSGLGLGLAIVKSLVELHGGFVSVTSSGEGMGSSFTVELPIYAVQIGEDLDEVQQLNTSEYEEYSLEGLKILVVEDQEEAARALALLLERAGARVEIESNGKLGFAAYSSKLENPYDLIISDIGMPEWTGYEFIKEVRALEKARKVKPVPAIALTAYASSSDRVACIKAGFKTHLPKPIDFHELFTVIDSLEINKEES